ncbi:1-phosphofructokinase family hexose kinase [Ramlibacter tataouinensis]|uniref:1-phosphofructokinase family hexose kinase n=1 Tax=Ramlibacter tataouinensis TaxID=94132 RepID=UPI0022F3B231|nr:1-phosphofructokinase family hexose kinase [Ramlibacter tataouinensis]WBY00370.1 1-phosphofructokinase family hexose kinase [Ramlibacter tataouinensis]
MAAIVTLTLNPALDVSTRTERVLDAHKLRCEQPRFDPGGGGINVARVLHRLGAEVAAVFPCGGSTGDRLRERVQAEGVPVHCVGIGGETRESFTVNETATGREYRFVLPGPELAESEWRACLDALGAFAPAPRWIIASGSLAPGVPLAFQQALAAAAQRLGSRLVVDTSGPALAAAFAAGLYLAKPSLSELRTLTGEPLAVEADWLRAARRLIEQGRAEIIAVSLGAKGALLVTRDQSLRAPGLSVDVAGTVGAGDSFLAGLVSVLARGGDLPDALATAMAAGAAALLGGGTSLARPQDIDRLRAQVQVRPV